MDLSNTIVINLLVFVFLLLVFERMRHMKSVYFPRDEWCVGDSGLCVWVAGYFLSLLSAWKGREGKREAINELRANHRLLIDP
jgi:uncharacterized membrane protein